MFLYRFTSIMPIAIFIRIAAMTGIGRSLKKSKSSHPMIRVKIAVRNAAIRWVAPFFILKAVRTRTAVAGNPQAIPEAIFANPSPNISLSLLKLFFVIFSAIFAEIIVSRIAIMAIIRENLRISLSVSILEKRSSRIPEKSGTSTSEKARLGNLVAMVCTTGKKAGQRCAHCRYVTSPPNAIPIIVRGIAPGIFGAKCFIRIRKIKLTKNIRNASQFISEIWEKV